MPAWLEKILGTVYEQIPPALKPVCKRIFLKTTLRIESLVRRRRILSAPRVAFVDQEVADLESYEFLSPAADEITVKAAASTISPGTENAVLCGLPGARRFFPYFPGYSLSGTVVHVGTNIESFVPGDRVAGRVPHAGMATVPAGHLFKIPETVSFREASFIELGIIVLQGLRKAKLRPGDKVAVLGQGLIGQLCNRVLRVMGAGEVIAVAPSRKRAPVALKSGGADRFVMVPAEAPPEELQADLVIEAVGSPGAVGVAMRCAREGGRVALLGSARGLSREFDMHRLIRQRRLEVVGAHISAMPDSDTSPSRWTYREEGELFLKLLERRMLSVDPLITWKAAPREANAVYECIAEGGAQHVGIVFCW